MEATKIFTFDCCHILTGHEGKCASLHGHTYKLEVTVRTDEGLIAEGSSKDMVLDFADLKKIVNETVIDKFDHAFIFDATNKGEATAEWQIANIAGNWGLRSYGMPGRTTAECMVKRMYDLLVQQLPAEIDYLKLKLWETPTGFVEYGGE